MQPFLFVGLGCLSINILLGQDFKEVKKIVPFDPDGKVLIDTYKGSITVKTWEKNQVEIYAKIEPDSYCEDNEKKVQEMEIKIDSSQSFVKIVSDYSKVKKDCFEFFKSSCCNLPFVHYTISMPLTAQLEIKDYKSEIDVSDLKSQAKINTYKENVAISGLDGFLELETYKGSVVISGLTGFLYLETYKGDANVEFSKLEERSNFETYKGDIKISIPKEQGFNLDADTGRRESLESDFDILLGKIQREGKGYRGTVNDG